MKQNISGFLKKHAASILTFAGAAGVAATAIMAAKAVPKATRLIERSSREKEKVLTKAEVFKAAAPAYIPAAVTGILTISCILGANILNKHTQASLAGAYAMLGNAYANYKNKNIECNGMEAHDKVIRAMAAEKSKDTYIFTPGLAASCSLSFDGIDEEERLFYDSFSDRYFQSTISRVIQAEYHLNRNFILGADVTLNDFYEFLGLAPADFGDNVGWLSYWDEGIAWIDFDHSVAKLEDGLECCVIDMVYPPMPEIPESQ